MTPLICAYKDRIEGTCKFGDPCAHEYCENCKDLSIPAATSDFCVCCRCLNLNDYDKPRRLAAIAREHELRALTAWNADHSYTQLPRKWESGRIKIRRVK